jgi:tRNA(Ile)-lysidine synthase
LLAELADIDIAASPSADRLDIRSLLTLSAQRQRNVIRHAVRRCGLPGPPATRLYQAVHELIPARQDAQPLVQWPGAEIRRYRDHLYILAPRTNAAEAPAHVLLPDSTVDLGIGQGSLTLRPHQGTGIDPERARQGLAIRYRDGGEDITPAGQDHRRKLKKMLQEEGIVPWMRDRLPLLFSGERLVAVADLWLDKDFLAPDGFTVHWANRPALY